MDKITSSAFQRYLHRPPWLHHPDATRLTRKKGASRKVKDLREAIAAAGNDGAELEAQQQHLRRQMATLSDRIKRLESQVGRAGGLH